MRTTPLGLVLSLALCGICLRRAQTAYEAWSLPAAFMYACAGGFFFTAARSRNWWPRWGS